MRRLFMSEYILECEQAKRGVKVTGLSASALMSILSTAKMDIFEGLAPPQRNGERADFIRRIEPLWGKGSLYEERFIGAWMASDAEYKAATPAELMEKQGQLQEIYEGRIASLQRLVSFFVMFHAMAKSVQDFWPKVYPSASSNPNPLSLTLTLILTLTLTLTLTPHPSPSPSPSP